MYEVIGARSAVRLTRASLTFTMTTPEESAHPAYRAALLHMIVFAGNIHDALLAYQDGDRADALRNKRFGNGIAREIVSTVQTFKVLLHGEPCQWSSLSALGIASAIQNMKPGLTPFVALPAITEEVLKTATWHGLAIEVRPENLNVGDLLDLGASLPRNLPEDLSTTQWWHWPSDLNSGMPSWWLAPKPSVVRQNSLSQHI